MKDIARNRETLDRLHEKIEAARHRLELKGLFTKGHRATRDDLLERYKLLKKAA
jgi:hypothetical protein